jgi:hypothetical protein
MKSAALDVLTKGVVAVACNDAGAANIIINWLRVMPQVKVRAHLGGPAIALWYREFPDSINFSLDDALQGSSLLLSGTGWASSLEHNARSGASSKGIFSIAVIDHWVNYESRFVRDGSVVYPDEIWVVDEHGYRLANSVFTNQTIRMLPNYYLDEQVALTKIFGKTLPDHDGETNILFALEPIRTTWQENDLRAGEFQALDYFIQHLGLITQGVVNIKLRPHPSDYPRKYDDWIDRQTLGAKLHVSQNSALAEDLAWSDIVVGCQTYVLIIALTSGKRTISCLPPYAPESLLPYPGIEELRQIRGALR